MSGRPGAVHMAGAATRAGIGYQPVQPIQPIQAPPAPSKQKHEVMEWDPATGKMVATIIEIETGDSTQAPQAPPPPQIPPQAPPAQMSAGPVPQAPAVADEYDPFAEGMDLPQREKDIFEIDYLLLGERSNFFETVKLGAPKADEPSCVGPGRPTESTPAAAMSRVSTSDSMEVDAGGDTSKAADAPEQEVADQPMQPAKVAVEDQADAVGEVDGQAASFDPYLAETAQEGETEGVAAADEKKDDVTSQEQTFQ